MINYFKKKIGSVIYHFLLLYKPSIAYINLKYKNLKHPEFLNDHLVDSIVSKKAKIYPIYRIFNSEIDDYTYISENSIINNTIIGKFCSIGPNLLSGWGIHPQNCLSTSPMFYSTLKQNGYSLSSQNKIVEQKKIHIGNDVFIGMNVTILDGVHIGDGAIIGAGAVVSKNIPPYAIAIGNPIQILKYRFPAEIIDKLLKIKWWNFEYSSLQDVEKYFNDIDTFINKYS